MSDQAPVNVRVTRRFSASAQRVFEAWLDPEMIGRWMFGAALREEKILRLSIDARVGGQFSFVVLRQGKELDHTGKYLELIRPSRLVFTWGVGPGDSSQVSVDIVSIGLGCELTLQHALHPDWANFAAQTEAGWAKMLGVLADLLA